MDFGGDVFGYLGRNIIHDHNSVLLKKLPGHSEHHAGRRHIPQLPTLSKLPLSPDGASNKDSHPVGILGAGVGGLYTALMLDSLDIKYEILEASDHTGGRLFTYKFPDSNEYDYYDVGAMRFPLPQKDSEGNYKTGIMKRLGDLINYSKLNDGEIIPLKSKLIDYYYEARRGGSFLYFNNEQYQVSDKSHPPDFHAGKMGVESEYVTVGVKKIVDDVIEPFARMLIDDLEKQVTKGWEVMKKNDAYSLRAYMLFKYIPSVNLKLPPMHLSTNVINWCETFEDSTGSYDRALTEAVLESLAFAKADSGIVEWKCFNGGSQVLTEYMTDYITKKKPGAIKLNNRVTCISQDTDTMKVSARNTVNGKVTTAYTYSHVISTTPLPCLRAMDLSGAGLNVMQKNALRKLQYGPSIKVGIYFKSAWWTDLFGIEGGQSFTDLPIRTIVYPSYGIYSSSPSTVLIASYCWTNDAERLGALINSGKDSYNEQLKELVLRDLAAVHGDKANYQFLLDQFKDMHAWDWTCDPLTMGAFAQFGPGDFQDLYTSLTVPNQNKKFHFAGEAISTRHGWVVGALDSAWRAVYEYLLTSRTPQDTIDKFFKLWGTNVEWVHPSPLCGKDKDSAEANTMLRVHMGLAYAGELSGEVKF
ncbi:flavin-containing amine oxidoreductase-domain containing protein [Suillus bovinus]|uniref:flavin-containing amine oxidoreductase-domain containing protein n=1 Tax=Suillus bovinus TaxID=48563 RepID=UPI001B873AD1|nr:flavin-containing amine oxidoreductase-domain containing protein [Suillus bovinus]KAG2151158.1 flavin-containing amine oxidoreductase-domain containing protein [Suillus bovinus]